MHSLQTLSLLILLSASLLAGCGGKDHSRAEAAYTSAVNSARAKLKIPKSARFPPFKGEVKPQREGDSLNVVNVDGDSVEVMLMGRTAFVKGHYEAQNGFGVFLPGTFSAIMTEDSSTGEWKSLGGVDLERER